MIDWLHMCLENAEKITIKPGDLNGGGSFDATTDTGNKRYTAEDFKEDEKGIYAYLVNGDTLVLIHIKEKF